MDTTAINITRAHPETPRARKRTATSPLSEIDVGSAHIQPYTNINPNPSTHLASSNGSVNTQIESKLLDLRKQYHRALSNLTKTEHHLTFLQQCQSDSKIPKGLQIKITPQAFLSTETNINTEFTNIITQAEEELRNSLIRHYETINEALLEQISDLERKMAVATQTAPTETQTQHQELLDKTHNNISKRKTNLQDRANKKMETLKNPSSRPPRNRPQSKNKRNPTHKPQPPNPTHTHRTTHQQPRNTSHQQPRNTLPQKPQRQPQNTQNRTYNNPPPRQQRNYSYAEATQGFRPGGPGPNQPLQPTRPHLLPNPTSTTMDTQQLILQTLTQLLQTLQK